MTENGSNKTHPIDDDKSSSCWDDALLFEVAVDPFQQIAISGQEEGRAAGRRDGYLEGVNIGRTKGWEIGLELGYIHDFVEGILDGYQQQRLGQLKQQQQRISPPPHLSEQSIEQQCDESKSQKPEPRTSHRLERCLTLARDLVNMINEFPDPDTLLSQNMADIENSTNGFINSDYKNCHEDNGDEKSTNAPNCMGVGEGKLSMRPNPAPMLDISVSIERIRAKFKLLCVLLRTKHQFDLKKVLDSGSGPGGGGDGRDDSVNTPAEKNDQSMGARSFKDAPSNLKKITKGSNPSDQYMGTAQGKDSSGLDSDW